MAKQITFQYVNRTLLEKVIPRVILVFMCILYILPFYWMLISAIKSPGELLSIPPSLFPREFHFENYYAATQYIPFFRYMLNTLIIATFAVIGAIFSNSVVSYGLSRIQWRGRELVFYIVIATMFIPFPVTMIALFDIFAKFRLINTYIPLTLPYFVGSATQIFMMRQYLLGIPKEISDAGIIDGANEFQIFTRLILPIMRPVIAVVAIFIAVASWNDFLTPLIYLHKEDIYPISIGLQLFRSEHGLEYQLLMAASSMVALPVVVIFLCFQRFFVEGITIGAVKG
ncbi:MAG: carbohydrate ABC transporter permease [Spirochaetaceae bacterium]|jgi:multiple sugar transport system permease protein|nr:carbohydrate ABC transporter permease [Spirochaetaceae bacterium]